MFFYAKDTNDAEQIGHELESIFSEYECSIIIAHSGNDALKMIKDDRPENCPFKLLSQ